MGTERMDKFSPVCSIPNNPKGESWFMQIDAHMTFARHWDSISIAMLKKAPSAKPVLSHYPPSHTQDLDKMENRPGSRLCGPVFATSDLETQIIRTYSCKTHVRSSSFSTVKFLTLLINSGRFGRGWCLG
jgi:hypothetical protein